MRLENIKPHIEKILQNAKNSLFPIGLSENRGNQVKKAVFICSLKSHQDKKYSRSRFLLMLNHTSGGTAEVRLRDIGRIGGSGGIPGGRY
jgi:hypothetical protein